MSIEDIIIKHFTHNNEEVNSENIENVLKKIGRDNAGIDVASLCEQIKIPVTHIRKYNNPD